MVPFFFDLLLEKTGKEGAGQARDVEKTAAAFIPCTVDAKGAGRQGQRPAGTMRAPAFKRG